MTTYKSKAGVNRRILVPIVALLLCSFALIGAGYAALTSSVSSANNDVGSDGIVLTFTDGSGNNIASGDFSSDYSYQWGCDTVMDGTDTSYEYTYGPITNEKIGESNLRVDATSSTVSKVKITYVFTTSLSGGDLPTGMSVVVKIGSSTVDATEGLTQNITSKDVNNYGIEVLLSSTEQTVSDEPEPFSYTLKIIAEPVTP